MNIHERTLSVLACRVSGCLCTVPEIARSLVVFTCAQSSCMSSLGCPEKTGRVNHLRLPEVLMNSWRLCLALVPSWLIQAGDPSSCSASSDRAGCCVGSSVALCSQICATRKLCSLQQGRKCLGQNCGDPQKCMSGTINFWICSICTERSFC